ncbi:MAG: TonB-dependent receptor, partial [Gallionella sp.]
MNMGLQIGGKILALSCVYVGLVDAAHAADGSDAVQLDEVVVTGTREAQKKSETPATIGKISGEAVRAANVSHPSQIMGRVPGVWVNVTGGEGHQTAIRQPLTTGPVYSYLEDGVPTRSTGFFNHNALYEVNLPQSGGIEVTKGPGTALYGSDAIGGVINVLTRPAPAKPELEAKAEAGSFGWKRMLLSGGNTWGNDGARADLNLTSTGGWRQATGYDRQSGTVRWDKAVGEAAFLKTVATISNIDQKTAGSSTISLNDYLNNPTVNYTPISFRKVKAFRLSSAYETELSGGALLSLTPYYRNDDMDLLANWSLGYDPTVYNTNNQSLGLMAKYRVDFAPNRTRLIVGVDIDHSPGGRKENSITTTAAGTGYTRVYTSYVTGAQIYDYNVTYQGISPYIHGEMSPTPALRVTAGLRYDDMGYQYQNNLAATPISVVTSVGTKVYGHVADTDTNYRQVSPKLGAAYTFNENFNVFGAYNHAFRTPSEGQLFRPSAASNAGSAQTAAQAAVALKPVSVDSYELGLRGNSPAGIGYEASLYRMTKHDDILSYKDPLTTATTSTNAGETLHQGIEIGVKADIIKTLRLDIAYSYAKHTYEQWVLDPIVATADYSGHEMESAPRTIANIRLVYSPAIMNGGSLGAEVVTLGSYWLDAANTQTYAGHDLLNLTASYILNQDWQVYARLNNVTDKRYAESASLNGVNQVLAPG